jgi:hypothetical protein
MIDLMNVTEVRTNLEAVANRVASTDEKAALRLRSLSRAVGGGSYADAWAASDVHQLIEPDQIIERLKNQHAKEGVITWLEWIRNSLIFAPLVVTWFGISQAADKYTSLIKAHPDQITQPFLYLWQTGFGNRLAWWQTLSFLALVDFVLLTLVLVLTIAVNSLSNIGRLKREQEAEKLRGTLVHAIAGATLCLTTRNWQQPTNFVDRFDKAIAHFESAIGGLLTRMTALADRQEKELQVFIAFKTELDTIMKGVSSAQVDLKSSIQTLGTNVNSLLTPMQGIDGAMGNLSQRSQEVIRLLNGQITALQNLITKQEQWMLALGQALTKLEQIANIGVNLANKEAEISKQQASFLSTITTQQTTFLDVISKQRDAQIQLANDVNFVVNSVKDIVREIDLSSKNMHGLNVQLEGLVRRVAAMRP